MPDANVDRMMRQLRNGRPRTERHRMRKAQEDEMEAAPRMETETDRIILDAMADARARGATWNDIITALSAALIKAQSCGSAD